MRSVFLGELATQWEAHHFPALTGPPWQAFSFEDDWVAKLGVPPSASVAAYAVAEASARGVKTWRYVSAILYRLMDQEIAKSPSAHCREATEYISSE